MWHLLIFFSFKFLDHKKFNIVVMTFFKVKKYV